MPSEPSPVEVLSEDPGKKSQPYFVGAVHRTLGIIEFLAGRPGLEAGVSEIAEGVDLPRATVHRLLVNLEAFGYVTQREQNGTYRLGLRLLELGNLVASELTIVDIAHPHLVSLRDRSQETAQLAVLEGRQIVYLDKVDSERAVRLVSRVGARLPAHCTALGKALLASMDSREIRDLYEGVQLDRLTERSAGSLGELERRIADVQSTGYSVDDEEVEIGLRCVAAPIRNRAGAVVAAISVSAPVSRLPLEAVPRTGNLVREVADEISRDLGYADSLIGR